MADSLRSEPLIDRTNRSFEVEVVLWRQTGPSYPLNGYSKYGVLARVVKASSPRSPDTS